MTEQISFIDCVENLKRIILARGLTKKALDNRSIEEAKKLLLVLENDYKTLLSLQFFERELKGIMHNASLRRCVKGFIVALGLKLQDYEHYNTHAYYFNVIEDSIPLIFRYIHSSKFVQVIKNESVNRYAFKDFFASQ